MRYLYLMLVLLAVQLLQGCGDPTKSGRGFTLPEGDVEKGQAAFLELHCNSCHAVVGRADIPHVEDAAITVKLGGKVRIIQNYGQLVTSIINPSHRLAKGYPQAMVQTEGQSLMPNYNSVMTVQQLTDLVAFLQAQYEMDPVIQTRYPRYHYPK
ncbi:cytochrome c [Dasania sp. GY-MA-18]|uniref:Cytochrome c n=1 Tax=Dasania phycosphaerae TaxID=2950436 RepID=A0A9J6RGZ2_9GAMM|nr:MULTISPECIES: cytochrome c [Dasania]MCR8921304.1 cytochrome c [Dasania sp. GY-MA-18]MCZ0863732.1 cytochrome c [Dasania phycosphaerae]MCZ0867460.1 cytochrome c [Dasania phycosphaerae]